MGARTIPTARDLAGREQFDESDEESIELLKCEGGLSLAGPVERITLFPVRPWYESTQANGEAKFDG